MLPAFVPAATLAALLVALAAPAAAQQGIYTCTDAKGRRLTADRPIIDCIDREQTELNPGGGARRKIGPAPTAAERAAEEEKARLQEAERNRQADDRKREKALVTRYPSRAVHDQERAQALATVDSVAAAAQQRIKELVTQRRQLDSEVEFYKIDPSRMPAKLKRQVEDVDKQLDAQQRFVAQQDVEKVRVNTRFDEELSRLKLLWGQQGTPEPTTVAARAGASASRPASSSATR